METNEKRTTEAFYLQDARRGGGGDESEDWVLRSLQRKNEVNFY